METQKLHKVLAARGLAGRRACEAIIAAGRVMVDGKVVTKVGTRVASDADIRVDGRVLAEPPKVYYILYKPRGYVTTLSDDRGRKSVGELTKRLRRRVYPVGRLDQDSEGLLLLTNDGGLTNILTHPRFEIEKSYIVRARGLMERAAIEKMQSGIHLREGKVTSKVRILRRTRAVTTLLVTINRGYNRQIRRMCAAVGHPVVRLKRVGFGPLTLKGLARGKMRALKPDEINELRQLADKASQKAVDKGVKEPYGKVGTNGRTR